MFETHSEEWERVGLAVDYDKKSLRSARRRLAILVPLFIAVIVVYNNYRELVPLYDKTTRPQGQRVDNGDHRS